MAYVSFLTDVVSETLQSASSLSRLFRGRFKQRLQLNIFKITPLVSPLHSVRWCNSCNRSPTLKGSAGATGCIYIRYSDLTISLIPTPVKPPKHIYGHHDNIRNTIVEVFKGSSTAEVADASKCSSKYRISLDPLYLCILSVLDVFLILVASRRFAPLTLSSSGSPDSLRVFVPLQRASHSWTTASPHCSPPEQTAENNPRIPATATAAYRLWAGEHVDGLPVFFTHPVGSMLRTSTNVALARERASLSHFHGGLCCDFLCDCCALD